MTQRCGRPRPQVGREKLQSKNVRTYDLNLSFSLLKDMCVCVRALCNMKSIKHPENNSVKKGSSEDLEGHLHNHSDTPRGFQNSFRKLVGPPIRAVQKTRWSPNSSRTKRGIHKRGIHEKVKSPEF